MIGLKIKPARFVISQMRKAGKCGSPFW